MPYGDGAKAGAKIVDCTTIITPCGTHKQRRISYLAVKDAEIKEKEKPRLSKSEAEGGTKASKGG